MVQDLIGCSELLWLPPSYIFRYGELNVVKVLVEEASATLGVQ